ncbi:hypothetical protein [Brevibacterium gallinarum]|uniref:DUF4439 domain-containing protein n=1 Tax=Brevibacterium gallinarum TaxID=2762220 RepID=A0ABR8WSA2_9MICO|nr:hypothetical protein [Brevibacterium gallinarum]MBD8019601.1 hypothetical protein [Brevibacterium gallinarum]
MALQGKRISRRTLIGGAAALVLALSGCGLRLDRDPEVPALSTADEVRNTVARILARTEADGTDAEVVDTLAAAVGPEWAPPSELVTPTHTSGPDSYTYADGLHAAAEAIVTHFDDLDSMRAVLADVAVGAVLHLQQAGDDRAEALLETIRAVPADRPDTDAGASPSDGSATPAGEDEDADPQQQALTAFAEACYQGSYAYERTAVLVPADAPARQMMRTRITELDVAADLANERLADAGHPAAENRPAWQIDPDPASAGAETAGAAYEDALITRIQPLFGDDVQAPRLGLASLWQSASARAQLGQLQTLRFDITDPATATPTTEG